MPEFLRQFGVALFIFVTGLGGVMLPRVLARPGSGGGLSLANMLSCGVMIGGGLLHLLPDAVEDIGTEYPFAYLLFSLGMLLPLTVEHLAAPGHSPAKIARPLSSLVTPPSASSDSSSSPEESAIDNSRHGEMPHEHERERAAMLERSGSFATVAVLLAALGFHSLLEGLAQGSATDLKLSLKLLALITVHKGLAAFALGCVFIRSGLSRASCLRGGSVFAAATPVGVLVGSSARASIADGGWTSWVLALAAGSFCYVGLIEILPRELASRGAPKPAQFAALAAGFGLMAIIAVWL